MFYFFLLGKKNIQSLKISDTLGEYVHCKRYVACQAMDWIRCIPLNSKSSALAISGKDTECSPCNLSCEIDIGVLFDVSRISQIRFRSSFEKIYAFLNGRKSVHFWRMLSKKNVKWAKAYAKAYLAYSGCDNRYKSCQTLASSISNFNQSISMEVCNISERLYKVSSAPMTNRGT